MTVLLPTILIASLFIVAGYAMMLIRWFITWNLYEKKSLPVDAAANLTVSVVVAVRNEKHNIGNLIQHLQAQDYNWALTEIIISDDFSDDGTLEELTKLSDTVRQPAIPVRVITAGINDIQGKKAAMERGISAARGSMIITTDADCTMGLQWIRSYVDCYNHTKASIITGFVTIHPANEIMNSLQAIEFLSLSGTGAASVMMGKPLMCNGANLAFMKEAFMEAGGYAYGNTIPTGDDTFLLLSLAGMKNHTVAFNQSSASVVATKPLMTVYDFYHQRIRWASKVGIYREGYIRRTGLLIFLTNLLLLILPIFSFAGMVSWPFVCMVWMVKIMSDSLLLVKSIFFTQQKKLLYIILPALILYPLYAVSGVMLMTFNGGYSWKNRHWQQRSSSQS